MARKRKIPVRKHHGIRDPLKQLEVKEKKLANVINCPPQKGDEQKLSHKFAEFKKLADRVKTGKKLKKPNFGREDLPKSLNKNKANVSQSKIKAIKQFVNETDEDYLKRVNRMTSESLKEAKYEAKYGVNIVKNPTTGEISIQKKPKNEIDELLKEKQKKGKASGRKTTTKGTPLDPKEAKALIKKAIREDEEEKKIEAKKLVEYQRDEIRFGEIVHAPPTLTTPRKAEKSETVPRPGKKNNLLLKSLIDEKTAEDDDAVLKTKKPKLTIQTPTKAQLRGKRKDLPAHTRSMLEQERNKVIEIYRQLKKSKISAQ